MAAGLIMFAVLLWADRRWSGSGRLFWLFLFLYGIARAGIEEFMDSPRVLGPLTLAQLASLALAALSVVVWLVLGRRLPAATLRPAREGVSPGMARRPDDPQPGAGDSRG
jgi:prolipoprotein diacylglyceryltransferase